MKMALFIMIFLYAYYVIFEVFNGLYIVWVFVGITTLAVLIFDIDEEYSPYSAFDAVVFCVWIWGNGCGWASAGVI